MTARKEVGVKDIIWFNKYNVIRKLAEGGTSQVYLVKHIELGTYRVIKQLPKTSQAQHQFINEINSLKSRETSGIPIIYDVEEDQEYYYIIEEYMEGESLRAYRLSQSNISESKIIDFAIQICEVLHTLHSKKESVLYCDLKPENIILSGDKIKLVDFGASMLQKGNEKRTISCGTKGYAAPEQYGFQKLDVRSDIFGIGGVMYFLITGENYSGKKEDWVLLNQKKMYSRSLRKKVQKCLKHYPVERYESVEQLKKSLYTLQKRKKNEKQKTPYIIAVTGTQERVGTTHTAIMITEILNRCYGSALYVEAGEKQALAGIRREMGILKECPMVRGSMEEILSKYPEFSFYVFDFGSLAGPDEKYRKESIYKISNKYLIVSGIKSWESVPNQTKEESNEKILFLANFADGILFSSKCARLNRKGKWVRIPYVPNPFRVKEAWLKDLMEEILYDYKKEQKQ